MALLQMSISASVFILVVILLRFLFVHKLPKKTFMVLWGVALIQLLAPVSVQSPFSIFTAVDKVNRMFAGPAPEWISTPGSTTSSSSEMAGVTPSLTEPLTTPITPLNTATEVSPIVWLWLVGLTLCVLFFIIPHMKYRRIYKTAMPLQNDFIRKWQQSNPLWRDVQIKQLDTILTPLTYGIIRPIVLLPKGLADDDEHRLALILAHEYTHIRRFDTLTKWLLATGICVHWFNPLVWGMYMLANRDIELSCDETVIRKFGENTKSTYARALVHLEEKKLGLSPMISSFSKNSTEERIVAIMKTKKLTMAKLLLAIGLVVSVVIIFATTASDKTKAAAGGDKPIAAPSIAPSSTAIPSIYDDYHGPINMELMPHDISFNKKYDVPKLIEGLMASNYRAVYMDNDIYLRVLKDNTVQISKDNGEKWEAQDTEEINAKDFSTWLMIHDPNPGYSIKEVQSRLANGAEVKHIVFEKDVKEMYFIIDESGVQIELVQRVKLSSVLIDGQRMMMTSAIDPQKSGSFYDITPQKLESFYDLLVSHDIISKNLAKQDYEKKMKTVEELRKD